MFRFRSLTITGHEIDAGYPYCYNTLYNMSELILGTVGLSAKFVEVYYG